MNRTVVAIEQFGQSTTIKLDMAPVEVVGEGIGDIVDLSTVPDGTLVERGEALLALLRSNQGIRECLAAIFAMPPGAPPSPLYFHVSAAVSDTLCWEQIHDAPKGFFALDRRWPIGRIARRSVQLDLRTFTPPLRVVAVLSAAGRTGEQQLRALMAARQAAAVHLPISLHVISGEEDLSGIAVGAGVSFEVISTTGPGLSRQITAAQPHIVHVLCHGGGVAAGERMLAFAHSADFDAIEIDPGTLGSVRLPVKDLVDALRPCNPWLVVLGACETAAAGQPNKDLHEGPAAAHQMVSLGLPAVIGMRRLIDITATDGFCRDFYPEVFDLVTRAVAPGPAMVRPLDWAQALTAPRRAMSGPDPASVDSWTDPVLYAQDNLLQVFVPPTPLSADPLTEKQGSLDKYTDSLTTLVAKEAPPPVIDQVRQWIDDLQAQPAGGGA